MGSRSGYGPFTVCLSHDVDRIRKTIQYVTHFIAALRTGNTSLARYHLYSLLLKDHYWCFNDIMSLESGYGIRSTFFFLNETYPLNLLNPKSYRYAVGYYDIFNPRVANAIQRLDRCGWEVGLHGSFLSYTSNRLLKTEKAELERILGHRVAGIRQHYLNLDSRTWERQADAGFAYDASFGYTDAIGFRDGAYRAFRPFADRDFHVVPLAMMDSCLMKLADPFGAAVRLIQQARDKGAVLVLNWHQRMFNEKEHPGYRRLYSFIIEECRRRDASFQTIGDYLKTNCAS
jgi:peptidoglycan/xylan/chitin deacetylase (PgdA/CDA1 family)